MGGQKCGFSLLDGKECAGDSDCCFAFQHVKERIVGRGMFTQALALVKGEEGDGTCLLVDKSTADNRAFLVSYQFGKVSSFTCKFGGFFSAQILNFHILTTKPNSIKRFVQTPDEDLLSK